MYELRFAEPHRLTDGDGTTLRVAGYEDYGSMYTVELADGSTQSVGKQLIESVTEVEE